jgi:hypothetical protein
MSFSYAYIHQAKASHFVHEGCFVTSKFFIQLSSYKFLQHVLGLHEWLEKGPFRCLRFGRCAQRAHLKQPNEGAGQIKD